MPRRMELAGPLPGVDYATTTGLGSKATSHSQAGSRKAKWGFTQQGGRQFFNARRRENFEENCAWTRHFEAKLHPSDAEPSLLGVHAQQMLVLLQTTIPLLAADVDVYFGRDECTA